MNVLEYLKEHFVYLDGGMGTLLQERGLAPGELPERWNLSHGGDIVEIQTAYYDAGANIVCTNTFGANTVKFSEEELRAIIEAAVRNAKIARKNSRGTQEKFIALDVGPIGRLLEPYGDLPFEEAVKIYGKTVELGAALGVDLILIETMNDSYDTKAALLAAKENCSLPVFVSNAYSEDGKLMTGASAAAMVAMLEGMGADAVGANCSLGPKQLKAVVEEYLAYASVPVLLKPNAGLPRSEHGKTVYDVGPEEFALDLRDYAKSGVRLLGGCCGTTPAYIERTVSATADLQPAALCKKERTLVSSYARTVEFGGPPVLIGERINPTGKKKLKEALRQRDMEYLLREGLAQQENGAHILDVNVGLPEIDEPAMLRDAVCELQAVIDLPLQLDTTDVKAMESALRCYNGKAMVNSVNGKEEVMSQIFPLVKKYGGLVVCLTLDEDGIPADAKKRVRIAEKIIRRAADFGIEKKDLIFDPLAMAVSAEEGAALATLEALERIRNELGCHTSLGVSNVSFGLPHREVITASFFTSAMERGLSAAIMNPGAAEMQKSYLSFLALHGWDKNCAAYVERIGGYMNIPAAAAAEPKESRSAEKFAGDRGGLHHAIVKGLREQAADAARRLLETEEPLGLVERQIIPALDEVGRGFEQKTIYLPQLLMSAEAAQCAFEQIKRRMERSEREMQSRGKFVIATVRGDIHDIGKNIVKLILENYGFDVCDLGKDVPPEAVADKTEELHAPWVGLSALMTTTVPAMEETIRLLRERAPWAKVIVGGAVLTREYAKSIGADYYARDAMATVRFAMGEDTEGGEQ